MILRHRTTRRLAEQILETDPDTRFQEPGGQASCDGFSLCLETGPFLFGTPGDYARGKAAAFPGEGGPIILVVDVPEDVIASAINEWAPLSQALIQFDPGAGLERVTCRMANTSKAHRGTI